MYVISGANGRVGAAVAEQLLRNGAPVRVVVRREEVARAWCERGAQAAIADLRDEACLTAALDGAQGFFTLMPFDLTAPDLDAYARDVSESVAGAVSAARVQHTVMLSSGGADLPEGTGPIRGLHVMEQALRGTNTTLTALRSGHFQEKFTDVLEPARQEGIFPVFADSADVALPMVATGDIAKVAAEELLAGPRSSEAVDLVGPSYTERQVANLLGERLGRELHVVTVPEAGWPGALADAGFAPHIAESIAELYAADQAGRLGPRGDRAVHVHTPIDETVDKVLSSV
ncbi:MAG: NmrA family NAD(P)-binding protein [Micrococcus sp.]|nr:NmrA family NAD(P)-binding protein [Micrococcus sp.]